MGKVISKPPINNPDRAIILHDMDRNISILLPYCEEFDETIFPIILNYRDSIENIENIGDQVVAMANGY